ncbi:elongator complex protein 4 [Cladophialophora yegresii CBS 114405]|uniref:Elongator complex protein 4 n=1 Tax=Cladophialophora yegresii CBS 114405 TaxID=1182544 RepID=W9VS85_9EURO|nr:elongator complex protein 4 [Cladophialophora yegresii CBS 114405]EXJ55840.1 elongator complex protein 4 [Cladophialophora yegresii CBS 114405]
MSFRKRNVGLSGSTRSDASPQTSSKFHVQLPGVRPSPVDGRLTTSTGTASLDALLAGHSGLALGCSLLIEESGTTDYAGALLRFYAAEGLLQGHHVQVIALPEHWGRELPGVVGESEKRDTPVETEKMKIAWRYESLGQFGASPSSRERSQASGIPQSGTAGQRASIAFCHTFDLTKRLIHPASSKLTFAPLGANPTQSPFTAVLDQLKASVSSSAPNIVHRIVIPSMLSPALYPPWASQPQYILQFMHGIRALFAAFPDRLTMMMSLPLSLYPRSSGLVIWMEHLHDGILELAPFPHSAEGDMNVTRGPSGTSDEPPQGLLQVHRLPMLHDRGSGVGTSENDWTFTLSRRKFTINPFNLPPVEGDTDAQQRADSDKSTKRSDVEF